jgi:hypothetical protein
MSIINEALQKAGENKKTVLATILKQSAKTSTANPPLKDKSKLSPKWIYITGIIIIISVLIPFIHLRMKVSTSRKTDALTEVVAIEEAHIAELDKPKIINKDILPIVKDSAPDAKELMLSGIVLGEGSPMAIINGSVYMKNDEIEGFKITDIKKDTVSVERNGTIIELQVR